MKKRLKLRDQKISIISLLLNIIATLFLIYTVMTCTGYLYAATQGVYICIYIPCVIVVFIMSVIDMFRGSSVGGVVFLINILLSLFTHGFIISWYH